MPVSPLVIAQCALILVALAWMAVRPPERGAMLLVPVWTGAIAGPIRIAQAGDAPMLGQGPFPGSIVVMGDRRRLASLLPGTGILLVAAPPAGCGLSGTEVAA